MEITKLVIFGFGRHADVTVDFTAASTVLFGPNEAGKTTMQEFILQTLFGFPARSQSGRRYEPRVGAAYGGQVHVADEDFGNVIIERTGGKARGDVTLYFEDGRRGQEPELQQLLRHYDRASFEAIFSFSIHELQHLDKLTEEELSRTLLASGTTGMDAVAALEGQLDKEMAGLFKKSGRNPAINSLVEELQVLESGLKEQRELTEQYAPAVKRIQQIEERLREIGRTEEETESLRKQAEKWEQAFPLLTHAEQLRAELGRLGVETFPADGRRRMDRLEDRLTETAATIRGLEEEQADIAESAVQTEQNDELGQLAGRESEWQQLIQSGRMQAEQAARIESEKARLLGLLGTDETSAQRADVSLVQEERLAEAVRLADEEEEADRYARRRIEEERRLAAEAEQEMRIFLQAEPSEEERLAAEEWQEAEPKLRASRTNAKRGTLQPLPAALTLLGMVAAVYGLLQPQWVIAAIGAALLAGGAWLLLRPAAPHTDAELERYSGKEKQYEEACAKVARFDEQLDRLMEAVDTAKRRIVLASEGRPGRDAREACAALFAELGFPSDTGRTTALESFRKLREFQALDFEHRRLLTEQQELQQELADWQERAEAALGKPVTRDELQYEVKAAWIALLRRNEEAEKKRGRLEELERERAKLQSFQTGLLAERSALFRAAGVTGKSAFYELADRWDRRQELAQQLAPIERQLAGIGEVEEPPGWSEHFIENCGRQLAACKEERHALLDEKAEKQQFVNRLLTDEAYEEKLQQFEGKKAELADLAKRWAACQVLSEAIRRMMDELKETRLPLVMQHAQRFFAFLTEGRYSGLELAEDGKFEALRQDGIRFRIGELSQATKEQAYIALRLALADSLKGSHPFPVIMDDPFVHFDRSRRAQMINLLTELQNQHQFIYFTCHSGIREQWPGAQAIDIAAIGRGVHQ